MSFGSCLYINGDQWVKTDPGLSYLGSLKEVRAAHRVRTLNIAKISIDHKIVHIKTNLNLKTW